MSWGSAEMMGDKVGEDSGGVSGKRGGAKGVEEGKEILWRLGRCWGWS